MHDTQMLEAVAPSPPQADVPPPPRAGRRPAGLALVALLSALVGGGVVVIVAPERDAAPSVARVASPVAPVDGADALSGVAGVAEAVMPSIVRIDVEGAPGPFGRANGGTGSGVIFTEDGYVLTNDHVVDGARAIEVTLSTGKKLPARLVGTAAPGDDIAVVKVEATDLPAATLGTTTSLRVGDLAVAIGSPFGLQGSVTAGVVSALHRNIDLGPGAHLTDAIQTDAPINPGNSGGALANARGEIVGINTAIVGGSGNVGVGFAIPIDIAQRDAEQIIRTGRARRPFLGISGESLPEGGGALIQDVVDGGPADRAGLRPGDAIVAVGSSAVGSMDELISVLSRHEPGDHVTISYVRDDRRSSVRATLSARPSG